MRRLGWVAVTALMALAAIGCGRREDRAAGGDSGAAGPLGERASLATDPALAAMAPRLEEWSRRWAAVVPGFVLDSLYRESGQSFAPSYKRPITREDLARARAFGEASPDSTRIVEPDSYRALVDGAWELWGEPDSAPALLDLRSDSLSILTVTGPSGEFEEAFWIDADRFVVVGCGERQFEPWTGGGDLWVYDLARGTLTWYHTPDVGKQAYDRYVRSSRNASRKRIAVGGAA
jgi:hypothetical protein